MKVLVWAVILAVLAGGLVLVGQSYWDQDPGKTIATACAEGAEGKVIFEAAVATLLIQEVPETPEGYEDYPAWVKQHWVLKEKGGARVDMKHSKGQKAIPRNKDVGVVDLFVSAELEAGKTYTVEFTPSTAEGKTYGMEFVASPDETPFKRRIFKLIK